MAVLDELLVRLGVDMSEAESEVERGADGITGQLDGLAVAGGAAAVGLGAAFVTGLESAMDISSVTNQLQNQLDLTDEEAARAGGLAGDVFSAGFGESLADVGEALGAVSGSMAEFGSISDKEMAQLTKDALALAKTFQFDVAEATAAAGTLIKAGLAKDGTEAMDLLTAAAQKLPAALREELPTLTREYSEFFSQLGFSGPEMMGLLAEAAKNPVFEIDKVGDALKELSLRLADTAAVEAPLKDLGLDVAEIQKLVNTGQGTKAFDQIITALKGVDDQTQRTALQAALFGGPGEDMGNTLLQLSASGAAARTGMDQAAGAAKGVTDNMAAAPAQQWDAIMRTVTTTLGQMLLPALTFVADLFAKYPGLVQILVPVVLALAAGLAIAAAAQWAMNSAMLASPVTWIVLGIALIVAAIVLIATKTRWFQTAWQAVWGAIRVAASTVSSWFTNTLKPAILGVFTSIGSGAGSMWRTVQGWWNSLMSFLGGIPGRIAGIASGMWNAIPASFRSAINAVIGMWNGLSFTIGGGSIMGVDIPSLTLGTPNIPMLAEGGIATGPTVAMVGEGPEKEAILPLSRLDQLLNSSSRVSSRLQPAEARFVLAFEGADQAFVTFLQEITHRKGGGSIAKLAGEG